MANIQIRAIEFVKNDINGERVTNYEIQWRNEPKNIRSIDSWKTVPVKRTASPTDFNRWLNGAND